MEMIEGLGDMVVELLKQNYKETKQQPARLIFFRSVELGRAFNSSRRS